MWINLFYRKHIASTRWATNMMLIASCAAQMSGSSTTKHGLMPPSQSVAPAILTANSGPKRSGSGNNWSPWYRLRAGKAPGGYTLQNVEFWLTGDRTCDAGAECREVERNDDQVLWEFRLKGRVETGAPAKYDSVAHIRVLYREQE